MTILIARQEIGHESATLSKLSISAIPVCNFLYLKAIYADKTVMAKAYCVAGTDTAQYAILAI
ncbi:MAG: hypothetical protein ABI947_08525 [Chloroflexota bacterium]